MTTVQATLLRLWAGWKRIAQQIADVQARIMLFVFYFSVLMPFALIVKVSSDRLRLSGRPAWLERPPVGDPLTFARRQF